VVLQIEVLGHLGDQPVDDLASLGKAAAMRTDDVDISHVVFLFPFVRKNV
jgi:hypothetical protein